MGLPSIYGQDPRNSFVRFVPNLYRLGLALGSSHYFEIASEVEGGIPTILQFATAPQYDLSAQLDSEPNESALLNSREVVGIGSKTADKIIFVVGGSAHAIVHLLNRLNSENSGYVLVAHGNLLFDLSTDHLTYEDISNAATVVEDTTYQSWRSLRSLEGHVKGLFMDSDILFLTSSLSIEKLEGAFGKENVKMVVEGSATVLVIDRKVKVTVDERIPRGEIVLVD